VDPFNMVRDFLFCGGPSVCLSDWLLSPYGLSTGGIESWPQFNGRTVIGTHRGRTAVTLACRMLGLGAGHEVLMPAYHCGTELDALLHAGVTPVAYQVTRDCAIDLEDLIARKTDRTRAVYLIHYFGWEQPMKELRRWCDEHDILLIEDCALALFSSGQSGAIGRTGDAAIYSLPKSLGLLYGGLLSLSAQHTAAPPRLKPGGNAIWMREIRHSACVAILQALDGLGLCRGLLWMRRRMRNRRANAAGPNGLPDMPHNYYFDPTQDADRALHPRAAAILASQSHENIIRTRCANYLRLATALDGIDGLTLLFPRLRAGVCPSALPLLVSNRDSLAAKLQERGIAAFPWWAGFHRCGLNWDGFPDACFLKNHLLTLPIDQDLDIPRIDELATVVVHLLRSKTSKQSGNPNF
jgi:dTDP-4-amino-4,6-dideoxygalactose transaminase